MRDVHRITVTADTVHLVPARIVTVVHAAVTAAEAKECHGGHARGSENYAEDVEVHLYKLDKVLCVCRPRAQPVDQVRRY
jgi:hypothetical protein